MEVSFTPEVESQLQQAAAHSGKSPRQFLEDSISKTLERRAEYIEVVEVGVAAADRGELVEHEEAVRHLNQPLHS